MRTFRLFLFSLLVTVGFTQPLQAQNEDQLAGRFREHVLYLADDKLEGRETGTQGELLAKEYIKEQFKGVGLKSNVDFEQEFPFTNGKFLAEGSEFAIEGMDLKSGQDWYPLPQSGSGRGDGSIIDVKYGIQAPDKGREDYADVDPGQENIFVMELGSPDGVHPHSAFKDHYDISKKLELAQEMGAIAVIFVNNDATCSTPKNDFSRKIAAVGIPIFMVLEGKTTDFADKEVNFNIDLIEDKRVGYNVLGMLDNGAKYTVVIGGHYDHLGYGDAGSLHRGEPAIHNGADDNASGTGMVIELARSLKKKGPKNLNYLFMGFSGEEKGLLGSNYWAKNPTMDLGNIVAMINFDMVGRLDEKENTIGITGSGTSPFWNENLEKIEAGNLKIKTSESGIGPSDHTSFYLKDIPVLHFFSGTHEEYHKPTDDEELINYAGMVKIHDYVFALMEKLAEAGKIEFTKTKDADSKKAPKFSVTLGVVPDYLYDGKGMRIDGVSGDRPAEKAGIKAGDVVVKMGDLEIADMMSYMKALGAFKKGDKVTVEVIREGKTLQKKVQF